MLIEFRVENYRSLREEQVLSMEAGRGGDASDDRPRHVAGVNLDLLPVVALYGANASGKTNVLSALAFMRDAVLESANKWNPDEAIPRVPFAWGASKSQPSLFEVTFELDSIRYQYGFQLTEESIVEEWLFAWPHGKKQTWFERDGSTFKFGENLQGDNKLLQGVTRKNALFMSTAAQFGHPQISSIVKWFHTFELLNLDLGHNSTFKDFHTEFGIAELFGSLHKGFLKTFTEPELLRHRFMTLLRTADLGINDIKVESRKTTDGRPPFEIIQINHQAGDDDAWLRASQESKGTQTLLRFALPIVQAIQTGSVLLCDELESSLHPVMAQTIVRQFNDPVTNPLNAQLIFTTHDTNLLGTTLGDEPALRRDQVWLTEKNAEGATVLYPLTDFKPRKQENLERGYIQGRYGAVPYLGRFTLAAE